MSRVYNYIVCFDQLSNMFHVTIFYSTVNYTKICFWFITTIVYSSINLNHSNDDYILVFILLYIACLSEL